jgi:hypothetical protein
MGEYGEYGPLSNPTAVSNLWGRYRAYIGIGGGVRRNLWDSPSYMTFSYGFKNGTGEDYDKGERRKDELSFYIGVADTVALYVGAEAEEAGRDYRYRGNEVYGPRPGAGGST